MPQRLFATPVVFQQRGCVSVIIQTLPKRNPLSARQEGAGVCFVPKVPLLGCFPRRAPPFLGHRGTRFGTSRSTPAVLLRCLQVDNVGAEGVRQLTSEDRAGTPRDDSKLDGSEVMSAIEGPMKFRYAAKRPSEFANIIKSTEKVPAGPKAYAAMST